MKMTYKCFVFTVIVFIVACSNEKEPTQESQFQESELSEDNVFKGYVDVLNKAKGVEKSIQDAAQRQRENFENQEY